MFRGELIFQQIWAHSKKVSEHFFFTVVFFGSQKTGQTENQLPASSFWYIHTDIGSPAVSTPK